jgi:ribosomal protein L32
VVTGQADSCANCGETKQRHHVCFSCGYYRGRLVISHRPAA